MRSRADDALDRYYDEHYDTVVHGGIGGRVQRMFHTAVERPWTSNHTFDSVLEVGATSGEHLPFVRHDFSRYTMLDIRESDRAREVATANSRSGRSVEFITGDAQDLASIPDGSVDRLVAMCLLHHLPDPRSALENWRRVIRPGGALSIFLPCDPGALWRAGRSLTTFRAAQARGYSGLEIRYINACDHRNHIGSLRWMVEATFADDELAIHRFPLAALDSWNANLFMTFQIIKAGA